MRACAVCFYYRGERTPEGEGQCLRSPPALFLVHDAEGQATFVSMRPGVGSQDFCSLFSHRHGDVHLRRAEAAGEPPEA